MNVLILKLNATGDVVRTTPLLHRIRGNITWVTAQKNVVLLHGLVESLRCVSWAEREVVLDTEYDLAINLEDEADVAAFVERTRHKQLFGAYINKERQMAYTDDARQWFDMSLISAYGRTRADELKLRNRRTYQEIIFEGLGFRFAGESYLLPAVVETNLSGDVAMAPFAGPVWPMKNWAHYDQLKQDLEGTGLRVNVLPVRQSVLEHIADVKNHRCLVGGDSLPMHLALGVGVRCVTLFSCTSPWEIHDYGLLTKIISPLLGEFFYKRGIDLRATTAIAVEEVRGAVINHVQASTAGH